MTIKVGDTVRVLSWGTHKLGVVKAVSSKQAWVEYNDTMWTVYLDHLRKVEPAPSVPLTGAQVAQVLEAVGEVVGRSGYVALRLNMVAAAQAERERDQ